MLAAALSLAGAMPVAGRRSARQWLARAGARGGGYQPERGGVVAGTGIVVV
jgi:hypothetical protein